MQTNKFNCMSADLQVSKPEARIYLNSTKRERAMLIKDSDGDWGICIACWEGLKKGVAGVPGMAHIVFDLLSIQCTRKKVGPWKNVNESVLISIQQHLFL